ncbi:unnamed protein product [Eruca vesicaria subsp. sativa]|uniref:Uncharacterized protein n=1 Tax=Eruca vesicaria subsp. sativa TaxID=29727 RepID=A0ABC8J2V6_ERUVS|nr:unnamed protein product [Eruca vesicaria subsp. sativa]
MDFWVDLAGTLRRNQSPMLPSFNIEEMSDDASLGQGKFCDDPDAEKILEEADWAEEEREGSFDENDLMDEDDLLLEEEEEARDSHAMVPKQSMTSAIPSWWKGSPEADIPQGRSGAVAVNQGERSRQICTPPTKLELPTSKKKGTPSPIAAGMSLKKKKPPFGPRLPKISNLNKSY